MCDNKPFHFRCIVFQVCYIRDHKIDPKHIILRECQTAVHDNNTVFILKGSNLYEIFTLFTDSFGFIYFGNPVVPFPFLTRVEGIIF